MTFSICVREPYEFQPATDEGGADEPAADTEADREPATHYRFGVAVTTRLPAVGVLCPFASEDGAVATQSRVIWASR